MGGTHSQMTPEVQVGELGLSFGAQRSSFSVDRRSSWRGKALLICSGVAMIALLCVIGLDGKQTSARSLSMSASSEDNNGGTSGETAVKGDASDFIDTATSGITSTPSSARHPRVSPTGATRSAALWPCPRSTLR